MRFFADAQNDAPLHCHPEQSLPALPTLPTGRQAAGRRQTGEQADEGSLGF